MPNSSQNERTFDFVAACCIQIVSIIINNENAFCIVSHIWSSNNILLNLFTVPETFRARFWRPEQPAPAQPGTEPAGAARAGHLHRRAGHSATQPELEPAPDYHVQQFSTADGQPGQQHRGVAA